MLISPEYLAQQQQLHTDPAYGVASFAFGGVVAELLKQFRARSITDYGAGKCNLKRAVLETGKTDFEYFPYDPAFPEYGAPRPADLVCCIDVLEHIEPECLDAVLDDLCAITVKRGFFSVHCEPAVKVLTDGRNAHLIQKPSSWWLPRLCRSFEIKHLETSPGGFWTLVEPQRPAAAA